MFGVIWRIIFNPSILILITNENSTEIVQQIQKNYFLSSNRSLTISDLWRFQIFDNFRSLTISPIFHKLHQDGIATGFQSMSEFVVSVIKEPNSHGTLNLLSDPISVNDACLQNKVCNLLRGIVKRSGTAS